MTVAISVALRLLIRVGGVDGRTAEKLRIVEESFSGPRLGLGDGASAWDFQSSCCSPGARRIAKVGLATLPEFVPAMIVPERPEKVHRAGCRRIEIMSANGRRVIVDCDVDVEALLRIMRGLKRCHDPAAERRAGLAGDRPHRHEEGLCQPIAAGSGSAAARSAERSSVLLSWPPWRSFEGDLA